MFMKFDFKKDHFKVITHIYHLFFYYHVSKIVFTTLIQRICILHLGSLLTSNPLRLK